MPDDYTIKSNRSINVFDLRIILAAADNYATFAKSVQSEGGYVDPTDDILVGNPDGYIIGALWYDPEVEMVRVDFARNGEAH